MQRNTLEKVSGSSKFTTLNKNKGKIKIITQWALPVVFSVTEVCAIVVVVTVLAAVVVAACYDTHTHKPKKVVETRLVERDRRLLAHIVIGEVRARAVGGEGLVKEKSKVNLCRGKSPFQLGIASLINPSCQTHVGRGTAHVGTNPPINQAWLKTRCRGLRCCCRCTFWPICIYKHLWNGRGECRWRWLTENAADNLAYSWKNNENN